jgi:hypothetical protein
LAKFAAIYTVRPAAKMQFKCDYTVNMPNETIRVIASEIMAKSDNERYYPIGVRLEVRVDANDPDDAFEKAGKWAAAFVSTLSFVANVGMGGMRSELACNISDSEKSRTFLQLFHDLPVPSASVGEVDGEVITNVLGKLTEEKMAYSDRVGRAMSFYTKGLREIHPLERFTSFWFGLETLNQQLKEILSAPDEIARCRCGRERKVSSLTGIRELMRREVADGDRVFKDMRNLRVKAFHSTEPLSPLMPNIQADADLIQVLLRKVIFRFLDVPYEGKVVRAPIANIVPFWTGLEGTINGIESAEKLTESGEYPHLVMSGVSPQTVVGDDGKVTTNPNVNYSPVNLPDSAKFVVSGSRMYGEKGKVKKAKTLGIVTSDNQDSSNSSSTTS